MGITNTKGGLADNDDILTIQLVRVPTTGVLQVEVGYKAGDTGKSLTLDTLDASAGFRTQIEGTYAEIKNAINIAEGLT
jgi:hypothetical protein